MAISIENSVPPNSKEEIRENHSAGRWITTVIPAYNEEKSIAAVVLSAKKHSDRVIVVNDGSTDYTARLASAAGALVVNLPKNFGKGVALSIGLTTAAVDECDYIVCLDGDGQHDPEDIPRLTEILTDGNADMVIGSRFLTADSREEIPKYRRMGQRVLNYATNIGSIEKVTDSQSGFRAFRRDVVCLFDYNESGMGIESEITRAALGLGMKVVEVPVAARYSGLATSTLRPGKHGMSVLNSVLRSIRSEHPLLYFGVGGLTALTIGFAFGTWSLYVYIVEGFLPFGPTTIAALLVTIGVFSTLVGLVLNAINENTSRNGERYRKTP